MTSLYLTQPSFVAFACKTATLGPEYTSLHGTQTSPVILCMQNNVISIRFASLHGTQPLLDVFVCKAATLGPELQVSMGPRLHLCFLHSKQRL